MDPGFFLVFCVSAACILGSSSSGDRELVCHGLRKSFQGLAKKLSKCVHGSGIMRPSTCQACGETSAKDEVLQASLSDEAFDLADGDGNVEILSDDENRDEAEETEDTLQDLEEKLRICELKLEAKQLKPGNTLDTHLLVTQLICAPCVMCC